MAQTYPQSSFGKTFHSSRCHGGQLPMLAPAGMSLAEPVSSGHAHQRPPRPDLILVGELLCGGCDHRRQANNSHAPENSPLGISVWLFETHL